jgi:hypothetical protein
LCFYFVRFKPVILAFKKADITSLNQENSRNYLFKPEKSRHYRAKPEKARMIHFIQKKNTKAKTRMADLIQENKAR